MESGIYAIRNLVDGKFYIGSAKNFHNRWLRHQRDLRNNNHCSTKLLRAVNKHGIENFVFGIVEYVPYDKTIIVDREDHYIDLFNTKTSGYNIADASFGDVLSDHPNKSDIIARRSVTTKANNLTKTKEERSKIYGCHGANNGMYGKTHTPEARKIISEKLTGKESYRKDKSFDELFDKETSERLKKGLSDYAKTRTGEKNPFFGKTHSEETKQKLSIASTGRVSANRLAVVIEGIEYPSYAHASKTLDIPVVTIRWRVLSKNKKFVNYQFATHVMA